MNTLLNRDGAARAMGLRLAPKLEEPEPQHRVRRGPPCAWGHEKYICSYVGTMAAREMLVGGDL